MSKDNLFDEIDKKFLEQESSSHYPTSFSKTERELKRLEEIIKDEE